MNQLLAKMKSIGILTVLESIEHGDMVVACDNMPLSFALTSLE